MTTLQSINASASPEVQANENFETLSAAGIFGKRQPVTTGLTWGYYGGLYNGNTVANGTVTLTNAATNYVVVKRSDGVVSVSTSTTNWTDTATYAKLYQLTVAGGVVTAVVDARFDTAGLMAGAPAVAAGSEFVGLTFQSDTSSTADSDPGNGKFKWNNATQASSTVLFFDNQTLDAISSTTFFGSLTVNGYIYLQQGDDATKWQLWKWSAVTAGTGYYKFTVTLQASGGSITTGKTVYCVFTSAGGASLVNWADSLNSSSPNVSIPVAALSATAGAAALDVAIVPKGGGSFAVQVADGTTTGGNKRGGKAVDFQQTRASSSQVASGNTSFVAGASNTASNSNAVALGGDSSTASGAGAVVLAGTSHTASGTNSAVVSGNGNTASQTDAIVCGGASNQATAIRAAVLAGTTNVASGNYSAIVGGENNSATAADSLAAGVNNLADGVRSLVHGTRAVARTTVDSYTHGATRFAADGDNQFQRVLLSASTTNGTQTTATADRNSAATTNQLLLVNGSAFVFKGHLVARQNTTGDASAWTFEGAIKRGANAAATAMVAACTPVLVAQDAGAAAWALAVDADTTNGTLRVRVTGEAAKTIRWSGYVQSMQVAG